MSALPLLCITLHVACSLATFAVLAQDGTRQRVTETFEALDAGPYRGAPRVAVEPESLSGLQLLAWLLASFVLSQAWLGVWFISFLCWWRLK